MQALNLNSNIVHIPVRTFGAFLLMHIDGLTEDDTGFKLVAIGSLAFLIVESTGNLENEYRRIGAINIFRPNAYTTGTTISQARKAEKRGEHSWTVASTIYEIDG